jgi:hypothetical protein
MDGTESEVVNCERGNELPYSTKGVEYLDYMNNC